MAAYAALPAEVRATVDRAAKAYSRHLRSDFVGLVLHGSALKGGVIPGCSDIDLMLFVAATAVDPAGSLELDTVVAIQRDLARIELGPFLSIRCSVHSGAWPSSGPLLVAGAYAVVAGECPIPEATPAELFAAARANLSQIDLGQQRLRGELLSCGGGTLRSVVRLLCGDVWRVAASLQALRSGDPVGAWNTTKHELIAALDSGSAEARALGAWLRTLTRFFPVGRDADAGTDALYAGLAYLEAASTAAQQLNPTG